MRNILILIFCTTFFLSCNNSGFKQDGVIDRRTVEVKEYPDSLRVFEFPCDTLPLSQPDAGFIIKEDSLLIFIKPDAEKKIHIYNALNYDFLGSYLTKGRGPNEVLLLGPRVDQAIKDSAGLQIVINSYPQYVALFNVNKSLKENKTVYDKKYDFMEQGSGRKRIIAESSMFTLMPDGTLFSAQNPSLSGRRINNPCFFTYDFENNVLLDSLPKTAFRVDDIKKTSPLIVAGYTGIRDDYKICVAFRFVDAVKIFDFKTKQNKVIKMSENYPYAQFGEEYAIDMLTTPDYIFRVSKKVDSNNSSVRMHILNWQGEILGIFDLGDKFGPIWMNKKEKALYLVAENTGQVYKFDIAEVYR